jgi:hypothetical protein
MATENNQEENSMDPEMESILDDISLLLENEIDKYDTKKGDEFIIKKKLIQKMKKIENNEQKRRQVFDFLENKYNDISINRQKLFDIEHQNRKRICNQEEDIKSLTKNIASLKVNNTTSARKVERERYIRDTYDYNEKLYKIVISTLLILLILLILGQTEIIPFVISLIITFTVIIILSFYIYYYLNYNNINRDKFRHDKYMLDLSEIKEDSSCIPQKSSEERDAIDQQKKDLENLKTLTNN